MAESQIATFKIPEQLEIATEKQLKYTGMTKSELYRAALRRYIEQEGQFAFLQSYGVKQARKSGLTSEDAIVAAAVAVRRRGKKK